MKVCKLLLCMVLVLALTLGLTACSDDPTDASSAPDGAGNSDVSDVSSSVSTTTTTTAGVSDTTVLTTTTATKAPTAQNTTTSTTKKATTTTTTTTKAAPRPTLAQPAGSQVLDSRTYASKARIGDWGGPAYAVYSNKGYNRASIDVELSDVEINMVRKSDGKHLVGYIFLGMNIYDPNGGHWVNCLDAGLKYDGNAKQWVLFHFIYDVSAANQQKWYSSHRALDPTHDYRVTLDCSKSNGWVTLSAYDLTDDKLADSVEFQSRHSLKDGSNVDFLQDYAIDMPEDTMYDLSGNLHEDVYGEVSDQVWKEVILYNSNEDIYLRNVKITNARLGDQPWTADKTRLRGFSPDVKQADIGYDVVKVSKASLDTEFRLDIDLRY